MSTILMGIIAVLVLGPLLVPVIATITQPAFSRRYAYQTARHGGGDDGGGHAGPGGGEG